MNLPEELLNAIHDLFVLRYKTGSTPASTYHVHVCQGTKLQELQGLKKFQ